MKYLVRNLLVPLLFINLIPITNSCKKLEVPTIITSEVTNITGSSATSGGEITDEGSGTVVERGICWSKGIKPTITDNFTLEGGGVGTFVSNIANLDAATTYYVRAYAKNEDGVGYGMAVSFVTLGQKPSATTILTSSLTPNSAVLNGVINANHLSTTVSFEYGETTSYGSSVDATPSVVTGTNSTEVSANITGLSAVTTYHYRVKAVNSLGTTYSNDDTFTTIPFTLGQTFGGGLICYIDNTGKHVLIAAPSDQSTGTTWYNGTFIVTNASGATIGTGRSNTSAIIITQGAGNYAAKICDDLVLNGFDDWFLPSKDELNTMFENLKLNGIGGFADLHYWSSTENSINGAWDQYFVNGAAVGNDKSYSDGHVRAMRSF